jgi:hypothetical protein
MQQNIADYTVSMRHVPEKRRNRPSSISTQGTLPVLRQIRS